MIRPKVNFTEWIKPRTLAFTAAAGTLLIFIACAVGPDYVKPKTEAPAAYKEAA